MTSQGRLSGHRVIVVEDQFLLAEDLRRELEAAGAQVVGPFSDFLPAISTLRRQKPSCAVLDINLGRGRDFSAARALIARDVPVVFVTGYDAQVIPADLSGAAHVVKPARPAQVVDAVEALCAHERR